MGKRKNGEGSYGEKTIKGVKYKYYRDSNGKYTYAKTMKELNQKVALKKEKEKEEETLRTNSKGLLTLSEYADYWLKSKTTSIKETTYDGYEYILDMIIKNKKYMIGDMQIKSISKTQVQNLFDELAKDVARSTIFKTKTLLNQIFDKALEDKLVIINPVYKTVVPIEERVEKDTREIVILEQEDIIKFKKEANVINGDGTHKPCGKHGTPLYGMAAKISVFILNTGLRIGEAIDLQWTDVDLDKKIINVESNGIYVRDRRENAKTKYISKSSSTKTRRKRQIPLSDEAIDILNYCKEHSKGKYVFSTQNGTKYSRSNVDKTIKKIATRGGCEVQQCGAHALRHTFASQLFANGVDVNVVSKLLGHTKVSTTIDIYIHLLKNKNVEAINTLNELNKIGD